jgi:hypothetical protein
MLLAIKQVTFILSWSWLTVSIRAKKWVDETEYGLAGKYQGK